MCSYKEVRSWAHLRAQDGDRQAGLPGDGRHRAQREPRGLQHGPLLHVHLHVPAAHDSHFSRSCHDKARPRACVAIRVKQRAVGQTRVACC